MLSSLSTLFDRYVRYIRLWYYTIINPVLRLDNYIMYVTRIWLNYEKVAQKKFKIKSLPRHDEVKFLPVEEQMDLLRMRET